LSILATFLFFTVSRVQSDTIGEITFVCFAFSFLTISSSFSPSPPLLCQRINFQALLRPTPEWSIQHGCAIVPPPAVLSTGPILRAPKRRRGHILFRRDPELLNCHGAQLTVFVTWTFTRVCLGRECHNVLSRSRHDNHH